MEWTDLLDQLDHRCEQLYEEEFYEEAFAVSDLATKLRTYLRFEGALTMNDEYNEWEDRACEVSLRLSPCSDEFYDETEAAEKRAALDTLLANPFVEHQPAI